MVPWGGRENVWRGEKVGLRFRLFLGGLSKRGWGLVGCLSYLIGTSDPRCGNDSGSFVLHLALGYSQYTLSNTIQLPHKLQKKNYIACFTQEKEQKKN